MKKSLSAMIKAFLFEGVRIMDTVLITGGSRGIGKEISKRLSKKYLVAVNYNKSEKEAMELKKEILEAGGNCEIFKADIGKYDEVVNMINEIRKRMGNISVLINNAGISKYGLIQDISVDEWKKIFNVNVEGMFFTVKNVVPDMIKRKKGIIINISSMWGITGSSYETLYSSTKGAVNAFTKSLAKELGPSNIRVNAVAPGVINTEMNKDLSKEDVADLIYNTPLSRMGLSKDIANVVDFLISDEASFITGEIINVNGGFLI